MVVQNSPRHECTEYFCSVFVCLFVIFGSVFLFLFGLVWVLLLCLVCDSHLGMKYDGGQE